MENLILITKFFVLIFFVLDYLKGSNGNYTAVVFIVLAYISINVFMYIPRNKKIKLVLLITSICIILVSYYEVNILFILLVPINILELLILYKGEPSIFALLLLLVTSSALVDKSIFTEYIFVFLVSSEILYLAQKSYNKINNLSKINDKLRESNYRLSNNLNKDSEYKEQIIYTSQLEERNKITQEIHDSIGHTISGGLMQLEAAKLLIEKDPEKSKAIMQNVINVLREGMEVIRAALRNIKPSAEQLGINKIKLILDKFTLQSNIKVNLVYSGDIEKISFIQWKVIQANLSEALTNVIKYSKATSVTMTIQVLNKFIKAEIKDNGIGAGNISKGIGIRGMEERIQNLEGKIIIDGSGGFSIIMLLPIDK